MNKLLTIQETADLLRVEPVDVMRLINAEELHAVEITPDALRVQLSDLRTFLRVRRRGFRPTPGVRSPNVAVT